MKSPRPTLRVIAERLGISRAAVSMALRGDPSIPPSTRRKVEAVAREVGYRVSPEVALAMAAVRRAGGFEANINVMILYSGRRYGPYGEEVIAAARRVAPELGLNVDVLDMEPLSSGQRLQGVLASRGIRGVAFLPLPFDFAMPKLRWADFALLSLGTHLTGCRIDRVLPDHAGAVELAWNWLKEEGFIRMGFVTYRRSDEVLEAIPRHTFHRLWEMQGGRGKPLALRLPDWRDTERLRRWLDKEKPEAVILSDDELLDPLRKAGGKKGPRVISIGGVRVHPDLARVDVQAERVGEQAMRQLARMIHQGQSGIPECPVTVSVRGLVRK